MKGSVKYRDFYESIYRLSIAWSYWFYSQYTYKRLNIHIIISCHLISSILWRNDHSYSSYFYCCFVSRKIKFPIINKNFLLLHLEIKTKINVYYSGVISKIIMHCQNLQFNVDIFIFLSVYACRSESAVDLFFFF